MKLSYILLKTGKQHLHKIKQTESFPSFAPATNPCNDSDCQICFIKKTTQACDCKAGFKLASDGKTCEGKLNNKLHLQSTYISNFTPTTNILVFFRVCATYLNCQGRNGIARVKFLAFWVQNSGHLGDLPLFHFVLLGLSMPWCTMAYT